jgi:raffinose/stachyose/melibiose transport system permease protein
VKNPSKLLIAIFLFPTLILFFLVFAVPLGTIISTSFTDWKSIGKINFVGFENYKNLLINDKTFHTSTINTFKWMFLQCTVHVGLGVLVALLIRSKSFFSRFVGTVYIIPNIIAPAALATLFYFIFHPTIGLVNGFIRTFFNPEFSKNWYFEQDTAFFAVTMTTILYAGIITLIVSAQIASIDSSLYEAAEIDGASKMQADLFITLPLIKDTIGTALILSSIQTLKSFEVIYLTTNGGPGTTTMNFPVYMYSTYMSARKYGYGNAMGVISLLIGLCIIFLISRYVRTKNEN